MENIKIYNMDCLDGIKQIPDHSINCVVTDPPYFQGLTHNGSSYELADLNISAYFFKALMAEIRRVLVKDYSFYFFADWRGYAFYYPIIKFYDLPKSEGRLGIAVNTGNPDKQGLPNLLVTCRDVN